MILLDGKILSQKILKNLKIQIDESKVLDFRVPRLDILIVGDDFASQKYVNMKEKRAMEVGIKVVVHKFDSDVSEKEILELIEKLNIDNRIDGLMVQLPLPQNFNLENILESINPRKDVDGLTSSNLGKLFKNDSSAIISATARGILELLKEYKITIDGANVVIVGRSNIVGLPTAAVLQNENATITICHSHTKKLKDITKEADILVVAMGKAEYIDKGYVKKDAVVIDVGTNQNKDGVLVGDIDFKSVNKIVKYITPVPGGVGPMTIASLLLNLFEMYKKNVKRY